MVLEVVVLDDDELESGVELESDVNERVAVVVERVGVLAVGFKVRVELNGNEGGRSKSVV